MSTIEPLGVPADDGGADDELLADEDQLSAEAGREDTDPYDPEAAPEERGHPTRR